MAQQMVNGSYYHGDITVTQRMDDRYAVVGEPMNGKHKKPQNEKHSMKRKRTNMVKPCRIWKGVLLKGDELPCKAYGFAKKKGA